MKIKYCGNCNPDVHPRYVREALNRIFTERGDQGLVVAVNGCSRICITKGKVKNVPENAIIVGAGDVVKKLTPINRGGKNEP
jgi:hypothetical protein